MRFIYGLTVLCVCVILSACSLMQPYQQPVEQGQRLTTKMIQQLKPGMTKAQAKYILGDPNLVNPYSQNTWYYIYSLQKNNLPRSQNQLILQFKDDKLASIQGDYVPPSKIVYTTYHTK